MNRLACFLGFLLASAAVGMPVNGADLVIYGDIVHTVSGESLEPGVVLVRDRRIAAVGRPGAIPLPDGVRERRARVVTPGLIDAHSTIGMSGWLNQPHDQEQLEKSGPIQPELRAIDAFNPRDELVDFVRSLGVTTLHTGHAPGALVSGQTMIVKTYPQKLESSVMVETAMIAGTLGEGAVSEKPDKPPGTRAKAMALLRAELIRAAEYARKREATDAEKRPARDLRLEALAKLLDRSLPLLLTVQRHQDILAALRLAEEFKLRLVLDGVSDAPVVLGDLQRAGFPVLVHPTMARPFGASENLSQETAVALQQAGLPFAFQSGYESYVPKTRVVLFEAARAAANGLSFRDTLHAMTLGAARILGIADRVGSIEPGKDADLALFDGDPLEYVTRCTGVVVSGEVMDSSPR